MNAPIARAAVQDAFSFADEFGPQRVITINRPSVGLKAIAVIDNTACGPAVGGVRMAPDVSFEECFRLARAMTWKNAAAGLPHGGGKSVIFGDPRMTLAQKENLIRGFADSIRDIADYIPGPDMALTNFAWAGSRMKPAGPWACPKPSVGFRSIRLAQRDSAFHPASTLLVNLWALS